MCGIAGIVTRQDAGAADQQLVDRMVEAIRRRGPDDRGFLQRDGASLGMCRLAIIDLSGGHQPILNETRDVALICNGEIYNHEELRAELIAKGHRFTTASDVEVALHLYEDHGLDFVRHLRGMFAVAIWDSRSRHLMLVRDRVGIKPLYYRQLPGGGLAFGSELKSLVAAGLVDPEIDPQSLLAYFERGYVPAPRTIYSGVQKLSPGHQLVWKDGVIHQDRYWTLEFRPNLTIGISEWTERFVDLFRDTVRLHLRSDVPLGAFLSGGVDSSILVAVMANILRTPIRTFTVGMGASGQGVLDERKHAQAVSRRYGTNHTELEMEPNAIAAMDDIVEALDEPLADDSVFPTYHICRETAKEVKVALSGLGGDELFGGYERHLGLLWSEHLQRVPSSIRRSLIRPLVERLPEMRNGHYAINHLKRFVRAADLPPADRYDSFLAVFNADQCANLLRHSTRDLGSRDAYRAAHDFDSSRELLTNALLHDSRTYLPDDILALSDRLSMWHGLEVRVPFVDHVLMEFCATMPSSVKVRGRQKKFLLTQAARPLVPAEVLAHRKQGFSSPIASWFRGDLRQYLYESLSPGALASHGLLDGEVVRRLIDDHMARRELNDRKLFAILMFQKWYDKVHASVVVR